METKYNDHVKEVIGIGVANTKKRTWKQLVGKAFCNNLAKIREISYLTVQQLVANLQKEMAAQREETTAQR